MTLVVADTSPLNYLVLIDEVVVLQRMYRRVLVPEAVLCELRDSDAPERVLDWVRHLPEWVDVSPAPESSDRLERLDAGERAAILLAQALPSPVLLLIDDAEGRLEAERRRIPVTGTLGVLRAAAARGIIELPATLARLRKTNFRAPATLLEQLLAEDRDRRR